MERETFDLPSGTGSVQIRPVTGFEILVGRKKYDPTDDVARNQWVLACAMDVTPEYALHWMSTQPAGDFVAVTERIEVISGLSDKASAKEAYKAFRDAAEPGVGVLPGREAGDDGGDTPGDDDRG